MAVTFGGASMMQTEETVQGPPVPAALEVQHDHRFVNILLLGPTGVGKSTFINSLCNYCRYPSLDEALKGPIEAPIYSEITSSTAVGPKGEYVKEKFCVGVLDKSEIPSDGKDGSSCTQKCKAYIIPFGESLSIRLIDTPGIADTRGGDVDSDNMKNVVSFLSQYDELHAVCILLKPNEVRLTTSLKYSIVMLLEKLHKGASNNILFCFTNSRSTYFVPGTTLSLLNELFQPKSGSTDSINLKLSFNTDTMYFFDSEAFIFLAMKNQGRTFTSWQRQDYERSWEQSNQEAQRLIMHILTLEPHHIKDTLSLNRVRSMLESIQKPLGDIAVNIEKNLQEIERVKRLVKDCRGTISNSLDKLFIEEKYQETVALHHPRMICNQLSCADKICHDRCSPNETLLGVTVSKLDKLLSIRDILDIPDDGILCNKLSVRSGCCRSCGCANENHVRVSFEMRTSTRKAVDMEIRKVLEEAKSDEEKKAGILDTVEAKEKLMKKENEVVLQAAACFATFLEQNSIVTYHSSVPHYYEEQIKMLRALPADTDEERLNSLKRANELQEMLQKYHTKVRHFKHCSSKGQDLSNDEENKPITQNDVEQELEKLYKLPLHGPGLKKWAEGVQSVVIPVKGQEEVVFKEQLPSTDHVGLGKDGFRGNLFGRITGALKTGGRK